MKRKECEDESDYSSSYDSNSYHSGQSNSHQTQSDQEEEIDVDFDFKSPTEIDYHGIKSLLNSTFQHDDLIDTVSITEEIIKDCNFTVVKVDDQLDPFAIFGLLNIDFISKFLIQLDKSNQIEEYIKNARFCFNERLINMPPQILPPMFEIMVKSIRNQDFFIFISKIYVLTKGKKQKKEDKRQKEPLEYFYYQAEDEFIEKFACYSFDYQLENQQASDSRRVFQDEGVEQARRVFVLKRSDVLKLLPILAENLV